MQLCLHIKHKANGSIERYKARLISVGFIQTHGWAHKVLKVRRLLDAVVSLFKNKANGSIERYKAR